MLNMIINIKQMSTVTDEPSVKPQTSQHKRRKKPMEL